MTAFATAMNVIFADPNMAVNALWFAGGTGPGVVVRVIRKSPDEVQEFGAARLQQPGTTIDVRVSDMAAPAANDRLIIGDEPFIVQGTPRRDNLRLIWTVSLRPL